MSAEDLSQAIFWKVRGEEHLCGAAPCQQSSPGEPEGFALAVLPGKSHMVTLDGLELETRARAGVERTLHAPRNDPSGQSRDMLDPCLCGRGNEIKQSEN